jgi:hypothetical protein
LIISALVRDNFVDENLIILTQIKKIKASIMQMRWMSENGSDDCEKILYLQVFPGQPFKPYTEFPLLIQPDHIVPKIEDLLEGARQPEMQSIGSKGYATMQQLLKTGWKLVKS